MVDFIIAVGAVSMVAWNVIGKLRQRKNSKDKSLCGFECDFCEKKCIYRQPLTKLH